MIDRRVSRSRGDPALLGKQKPTVDPFLFKERSTFGVAEKVTVATSHETDT